MNRNSSNQMIGYAIMAILAYYVLQMIFPFLVYGVIAMVAWRVYLEYKNMK